MVAGCSTASVGEKTQLGGENSQKRAESLQQEVHRSPETEDETSDYVFAAISGISGRAAIIREELGGVPTVGSACVVFGLKLTKSDWSLIEPELQSSCAVVGDNGSLRSFGDRYSKTYNIDDLHLNEADEAEITHEGVSIRIQKNGLRIAATIDVGGSSILLGWFASDEQIEATRPSISVGPFEKARPHRDGLGALVYTVHPPGGDVTCGRPQAEDYYLNGPIWVSSKATQPTQFEINETGEIRPNQDPEVPFDRCNSAQTGPHWSHESDGCHYNREASYTNFLICQQ